MKLVCKNGLMLFGALFVLAACGGGSGDSTGTSGAAAAKLATGADGAPAAQQVKTTTVASGLQSPWSMAFLPDGRFLITERTGPIADCRG